MCVSDPVKVCACACPGVQSCGAREWAVKGSALPRDPAELRRRLQLPLLASTSATGSGLARGRPRPAEGRSRDLVVPVLALVPQVTPASSPNFGGAFRAPGPATPTWSWQQPRSALGYGRSLPGCLS